MWFVARGRFNWLLVNLATAFLASSVLGLFEGELQKMVALAVLAPIVASQGGNAATQTMTVAVRALAMHELSSTNAARLILREVLVGLVNGLAFAVITGVAAAAWFKVPDLGLVIGLAMICNLICNLLAGALGGILVPLVLHRFHADPAISSGVFVTTVTDVVGFFRSSASPRCGSGSNDRDSRRAGRDSLTSRLGGTVVIGQWLSIHRPTRPIACQPVNNRGST